jgi:hypothetical protein
LNFTKNSKHSWITSHTGGSSQKESGKIEDGGLNKKGRRLQNDNFLFVDDFLGFARFGCFLGGFFNKK